MTEDVFLTHKKKQEMMYDKQNNYFSENIQYFNKIFIYYRCPNICDTYSKFIKTIYL